MSRSYSAINNKGVTDLITNSGTISVVKTTSGQAASILSDVGSIGAVVNNGTLKAESPDSQAIGIRMARGSITNNGSIIAKGQYAWGISEYNNTNSIVNNGTILTIKTKDQYSDTATIEGASNAINNGVLIGDSSKFIQDGGKNQGLMFDDNKDGTYKIYGSAASSNQGNYSIQNATLKGQQIGADGSVTSATGSESFALNNSSASNTLYNGITDTIKVSGTSSLSHSSVNAYTSGIIFDDAGANLTLDSSNVNAGGKDNTNAIQGGSGSDTLTLKNSSSNGSVNLGDGNDKLVLQNNFNVNGTLSGGTGNDSLIFDANKDNIVSNNIDSFNDIIFKNNTSVTLHENASITGTDNIKIEAGSQVNLRVDTTKTDASGNYIGHALYNNGNNTVNIIGDTSKHDQDGVLDGTTYTDKVSVINLVTKGINNLTSQNGAQIDFGNTKIDSETTQSGQSSGGIWLRTDSILTHAEIKTEIVNGKVSTTVAVKGQNDIFNITKNDTTVSSSLNDIYKGIYSSGDANFSALNDVVVNYSFSEKDKGDYTTLRQDKAQLATLLSYLRNIYESTPYAFSNETTRRSLDTFHEAALSPNFKAKADEFIVNTGFTHNLLSSDSYYGTNYGVLI